MTALTDIADSAGATGSDIDTINFTVGVDACKLFYKLYYQKIKNDIWDIQSISRNILQKFSFTFVTVSSEWVIQKSNKAYFFIAVAFFYDFYLEIK